MKKLYIIPLFIFASLSTNAQTKLPSTVTKSGTSVNVINVVSGGTDPAINPDGTEYHEYVDLGLSVKWATCNVGAASPEEYGNYFAWGETTGYNEGKTTFDISNYTLCNGSSTTMTKYCQYSAHGTVDNKTVLEPEDDAATANWGGDWRMPTYEEFIEIKNNCYWEWTSNYNSTGIAGYLVYKVKVDTDGGVIKYIDKYFYGTIKGSYSLSDAHIFIPAAGELEDDTFWQVGSCGAYWTSTLCKNYSWKAYYIWFGSNFRSNSMDTHREYGLRVRPVHT